MVGTVCTLINDEILQFRIGVYFYGGVGSFTLNLYEDSDDKFIELICILKSSTGRVFELNESLFHRAGLREKGYITLSIFTYSLYTNATHYDNQMTANLL